MDLQKAKILLDKINSLHSSMAADAGNISSIERDLMRSYIRQLYETTMNWSDAPVAAPAPKPKAKVEIIKPKPRPIHRPAPPPVVEVAPPAPAPAPAPKRTYTPPRVIEIPDSLKDMDVPPPAPTPAPKPVTPPPPPVTVEVAAPIPTPPPAPVSAPKAAEVTEDVQQLFEHKAGTELSDKLSSLPIKDLTKAMGLNERIFTVNELFGGDNDAFNSAMIELNKLSSFDDAKTWLAQNVVAEYGWTKRSTKNKAKEFIKLIRRRYN